VLTDGVMPSGNAFQIYSASFHQHLLGTGGKLEIQRGTGGSECMLDIPRWDFHWQRTYPFSRAKIFRPGDKMSIECHWDNSAENQPYLDGAKATSRDVKWGEGTRDEMCLGVLYVSE
jgi:hypothetical protein